MKNGEKTISPKDNKSETLVLQEDGNLYGNRTHYNYGKMENKEENQTEEKNSENDSDEDKKESEEEKSDEEDSSEENKSEENN